MAKIFLRSGSLDAVLALGENGQPLWLSALQLRETLRLRKQSQVADCLAIPQPNDAGDRLDWYAPHAGKVTSWAAASNSARSAALSQLRACQQVMGQLSEQARESAKPSQRLFGALLSKALQFPDEYHVYLVDGKPVITFWGFVSLEKKAPKDALDYLQLTPDDEPLLGLSKLAPPPALPAVTLPPVEEEPVSVPVPAVVIATLPPPDEPVAVAPPAPLATPRQSGPSRGWRHLIWAVPLAALAVAVGVQYLPLTPSAAEPAPAVAATPPAAVIAPPAMAVAEVSPPAAPETPQHSEPAKAAIPASAAASLPLAPATLAEAKPAVVAEPEPQPQPVEETLPPPEKDDLVLPADDVKRGSTRFLNGNWRAIVRQKTPLTGRAPQIKYQLRNGTGTVRITQGDGVTCRAEVDSALMPSGNLAIKSRTTARCSDGTRYRMPELLCRQGLTGAAQCSGSYNDSNNTVLPMTMKRETR